MKKRFLVSLIIGFILLSMVGCGNDAVAELTDEIIKKDIQDYIVEMLGEDSEISVFEKVSSEAKGEKTVVVCTVLFTADGKEQQGEFTLSYGTEGEEWVLEKCKVEIDESQQTEESDEAAEPVDEATETEGSIDQTTEPEEQQPIDEVVEPEEPIVEVVEPEEPIVEVVEPEQQELTDESIKQDIQKCISERYGNNSQILIFEKLSSETTGEKVRVVCNVLFTGDGQEQQGKFTLIYGAEGSSWVLSMCSLEVLTKDNTLPTETINISDNLFDYEFCLDGVVYKLPCEYSKFVENGWIISSRGKTEKDEISANSYVYFNMIKDGCEITVYAINMSGNVKAIENCKIGGIEVCRYNFTDAKEFSIAKDINLDSTLEEITAAFGNANTVNTYEDVIYSTYIQDTNNSVKFTTYTNDVTKWNTITIKNFVSDGSDVTETSTAKPEYLATYKAPTELGNDIYSGIIELDGDLYRFPASVSAFTDNGWSITQQSNGVGAGNNDSIRIERNGKKMYLYIINLGTYQTIPENCAVYKVYVYNTDNIDAKLPGGISFDSTKADVENAVNDDFSYYKGSLAYSYSYSNYNINFDVSISVNIETEKVTQISLGCKHWDY